MVDFEAYKIKGGGEEESVFELFYLLLCWKSFFEFIPKQFNGWI